MVVVIYFLQDNMHMHSFSSVFALKLGQFILSNNFKSGVEMCRESAVQPWEIRSVSSRGRRSTPRIRRRCPMTLTMIGLTRDLNL